MSTLGISMPRVRNEKSVRPDYRKFPWWTPGEAAADAARTYATVKKWMRVPEAAIVNGRAEERQRFLMRSKRTPDRVDRDSFLEYVRTGEPQGEKA